MDKLRIGVAGIGKISEIYLKNLTGMFARRVTVTAVTDMIFERAEKAAAQYGLRAAVNIEELVKAPDVDIILNLTQPQTHYTLAMSAVKAGKHVYNEKPLCVTREQAKELLEAAGAQGVKVGGAPDTFLGAGLQTCRKLIDDGWIGRPLAASAFMMSHGPEHWHPAPEFFYKTGGGPMFDIGPYYLTALVSLLGPVAGLSGLAGKGFEKRTITSEPLYGTQVDVEIPTHVTGIMDFKSGVIGTIVTSFDVWSHGMPPMEIYGSEGTLQAPDPNIFGGPVRIKRFRAEDWSEIPLMSEFTANSRGLGIVDMAESISGGRPHRASGELAYHVLEIMHGIHDASVSKSFYHLKTSCERPAAFLEIPQTPL
jgi:predicted dehydrogenase